MNLEYLIVTLMDSSYFWIIMIGAIIFWLSLRATIKSGVKAGILAADKQQKFVQQKKERKRLQKEANELNKVLESDLKKSAEEGKKHRREEH